MPVEAFHNEWDQQSVQSIIRSEKAGKNTLSDADICEAESTPVWN